MRAYHAPMEVFMPLPQVIVDEGPTHAGRGYQCYSLSPGHDRTPGRCRCLSETPLVLLLRAFYSSCAY